MFRFIRCITYQVMSNWNLWNVDEDRDGDRINLLFSFFFFFLIVVGFLFLFNIYICISWLIRSQNNDFNRVCILMLDGRNEIIQWNDSKYDVRDWKVSFEWIRMSSLLFKLYETSFSINFVKKKKICKLDFMCLLMNHAYFIRTPRNTVDAGHEF